MYRFAWSSLGSIMLFAWFGAAGYAQKMSITTASDEARTAYQQGLQYLDTAQPESARPLFEQALALDPAFIMALDGLLQSAPTFKVAGEYFAQLRAMSDSVTLSEGEQLYFDAMFAGANGDQTRQRELSQLLTERFPDDERLWYRRALLYFGTDDATTVRLLRQALAANADFVPAYNILGYSLRALNNEAEAEVAFKQAITLNPTNPNAYDSYAELLLKMGRFDESIAYYDKALDLEPMFPSAQVGVAANLILQGRHAVARQRLDRLYEVAPHDGMRSGVYWAKAVTYVDEGDLERALEALNQNYRLSQKGHDFAAMALDLTNKAIVLRAAQRYDAALETLREALDYGLNAPNQNPRGQDFARAVSAYQKGLLLIERQAWEAATTEIAQAETLATKLESSALWQNVHELRGALALARGAYQEALAELEQANAVEVYNMFRIAQAYEGLGNLEQARAFYHYVVTYHSPLNLNYALVRQQAHQRLAQLNS